MLLTALALSLALNAVPIWLAWRGGAGGSQASSPTSRVEVLSTRTIARVPAPSAEPSAAPPEAAPVAAPQPAVPAERPARVERAESPALLVERSVREAGTPRSTASTAPERPDTVSAVPSLGLGELDRSPRPIGEVMPVYPEAAGSRSGSVVLRLVIDEHGVVERAEVVVARPAGLFEEAARAAFLAARFEPGLRAGRPVRSEMTIEVEFTAEEGGGSGSTRY